MELWFGTGLQTYVELPSVRDDLFHDGLHLVYLDGIDDEVLPLIAVLRGRLLETKGGFLDTVVKDVGKTKQHGGLHIAQGQFVHHFPQVNLRLVLAGCHVDIAFLVDAEIRGAPSTDVIKLLGIFNGPFLHIANNARSFSTLIFIFS